MNVLLIFTNRKYYPVLFPIYGAQLLVYDKAIKLEANDKSRVAISNKIEITNVKQNH